MLPVPSAHLGGIGGIEFPTLPPTPSGPNPTAPGSFSGLYDQMLTGADRMAASIGASKPTLPTAMEMRPIMAPSNDLSQPFVAGKEFPGAVDPNALRLPGSSNAASAGDRPTHPYSDMLSPLSNGLDQVNRLQKDAEGLANEAALGGDVDLHDVMIAGEKASVAMQLTLQVRNKLVEAYQEVMRMQV